MLSVCDMKEIVGNLESQDWVFLVEEKNNVPYLQVSFMGKCSVTGKVTEQKGRKWMLSEHMTKSELVQTAFLAVKQALEHEAREQFLYYGEPIFRPHFDVEYLWDLSLEGRLDYRKEG